LKLVDGYSIGPNIDGMDGGFVKYVGYHEIIIHVDVLAMDA
jgi:hypothetical protein